MPVDAWIGPSGLVWRIALRIRMHVPPTGADVEMTMRMDFSDFGVPVHVAAPPAAQTADLSALAASRSSG
jgi:hypothetical protein